MPIMIVVKLGEGTDTCSIEEHHAKTGSTDKEQVCCDKITKHALTCVKQLKEGQSCMLLEMEKDPGGEFNVIGHSKLGKGRPKPEEPLNEPEKYPKEFRVLVMKALSLLGNALEVGELVDSDDICIATKKQTDKLIEDEINSWSVETLRRIAHANIEKPLYGLLAQICTRCLNSGVPKEKMREIISDLGKKLL